MVEGIEKRFVAKESSKDALIITKEQETGPTGRGDTIPHGIARLEHDGDDDDWQLRAGRV